MDVQKIVVVDGHSKDRTVVIAKKLGAEVLMQDGKGKGAAFQTFLRKYNIRDNDNYVMLDADMTYDPKDIDRFSKVLNMYEVVSGDRYLKDRTSNYFVHRIGNKIISFFAFLMAWGWNPDICTGYWGFKGKALKKLRITASRFDLEADIYTEVKRNKLGYKRIKIWYYERVGERKLKKSDALLIMRKLFQKRFGH